MWRIINYWKHFVLILRELIKNYVKQIFFTSIAHISNQFSTIVAMNFYKTNRFSRNLKKGGKIFSSIRWLYVVNKIIVNDEIQLRLSEYINKQMWYICGFENLRRIIESSLSSNPHGVDNWLMVCFEIGGLRVPVNERIN